MLCRILPSSQRYSYPIPGTCDYITLHSKWDFRDSIKVKNLWMRRLLCIICTIYLFFIIYLYFYFIIYFIIYIFLFIIYLFINKITCVLENRNFFCCGQRKRCNQEVRVRGMWHCWLWTWRKATAKECVWIIEAGKDKKTDFLLEPPQENSALLIWFLPNKTCVGLPTYKTVR